MNKNRAIMIGVGVFVGLGLIGQIGSPEEQAATATTVKQTTTTAKAVTPPQSKEDLFLDMVHENVPNTGMSDGELLNFAYTICEYLDAGNSTNDVLRIAADSAVANGLNDSEIADLGTVLGYSTGAFCPEYQF